MSKELLKSVNAVIEAMNALSACLEREEELYSAQLAENPARGRSYLFDDDETVDEYGYPKETPGAVISAQEEMEYDDSLDAAAGANLAYRAEVEGYEIMPGGNPPESGSYSREDVKAAVSVALKEGKRDLIKRLFAKYNASKLSDLDTSGYSAFMADLDKEDA